MTDMKRISLSNRSKHKILHIEAPGCIINIQIGLRDAEGRDITRVDVMVDGDRYAGEPQWWVNGQKGTHAEGIRIVKTTA